METYVKGRVHTNGIENFWSLLQRQLLGTYVAVEPYHLHRYVDELVFRYSNRGGKRKGQRINDRTAVQYAAIADRGQTADLCGIDWQGGRNEFLILFGRSAARSRRRNS